MLHLVSITIRNGGVIRLICRSGAIRFAWKTYTHGRGAYWVRPSLGYCRHVLRWSTKLRRCLRVQVLHRIRRCVAWSLLTRFANASSEAGFSPLIQVFLSRFYARDKLGIRVAIWLAMAPIG